MGTQELLELCFPFESRAEIKILCTQFLYVLCTSRYIKKKFTMGSISVAYSVNVWKMTGVLDTFASLPPQWILKYELLL